MKLKLTTNLGTVDAARFDLDPEKAREGDVVDVKQAAADELIKNGWAVDPSTDTGPSAMKAVPPALSFDTMSKPDLLAYADLHKVHGVTPAMHKDDIVKALKHAHHEPRNV